LGPTSGPAATALDLSAILASYRGEKGQPPYHPATMAAQLLCGHLLLRGIARACVELAPLLDGIKAQFGPQSEASADAGYCSAANFHTTLSGRQIKGYVGTGRQQHGTKSAIVKRPAKPGSLLIRMTRRLRRADCRSRYRLRNRWSSRFGTDQAGKRAEWAMTIANVLT